MIGGVLDAVHTKGYTGAAAAGKTAAGVLGLIGQNIGNSVKSFFTGVQSTGESDNGISRMGKGTREGTTVNGNQGYAEAKHGANQYITDHLAQATPKQPAAKKSTPPKTPPPPPTPPSSQRQTP